MAKTTCENEPQDKTARIIEVAQKRFGMYGYEKTTMNEIANDLKMCKGSLYYYFPDKEHLYIEVVQKEHDVFLSIVNERLTQIDDPSEMIREYVIIRLSHFRKLLNLSRFRHDLAHEIHGMLHAKWALYRVDEVKIIKAILERGISKGVFEVENIDETADILLVVYKSLSMSVLRQKDIFYIEDGEYEGLKKKVLLFTEMMIKSLKK